MAVDAEAGETKVAVEVDAAVASTSTYVKGACCDGDLRVFPPGLLRSYRPWVLLLCISLVLWIYLGYCFRLRLIYICDTYT